MAKNQLKIFAAALILAGFLLGHYVQAGEDRSYHYDLIDVSIKVNSDSTFDVAERQIYNYQGEYHQGWRSIPLKKITGITDIEVIDGETGRALEYSSRRLDKTNPGNWGRYTHYKADGSQNIEWYYDLKNTSHEWIVKYKVHGGLSFLDNHDEIYWNLLTDFDVPIDKVVARVSLPKNDFSVGELLATLYWTDERGDRSISSQDPPVVVKEVGGSFVFDLPVTVQPKGKVTIAAGWSKGLIDQGAFWRDWFGFYWSYFLSFFIIILTFFVGLVHWYFTERFRKGRGTIIPQYEPPQNLPPAMSELIIKERTSQKTLPATLIDLAVRGYVKISEENNSFAVVAGIFPVWVILVPVIFFGFIGLRFLFLGANVKSTILLLVLTVAVLFLLIAKIWKRGNKDYLITKQKEYLDDPSLHDFEKDFLTALFGAGDRFSTGQNGFHRTGAAELYKKIKKVEENLLRETDLDSRDYQVGLVNKKYWGYYRLGLVIVIFIFIYLASYVELGGLAWVGFVFLTCLVSLVVWMRFNPRLSSAGFVDRENWLGFKRYLETAEKYRLQNLTPDLFEKYLPYAMVFGVEKKWAKNFEALNLQAPSWYVSSSTGLSNSSWASVGNFSASAFSSSFVSSFASAFSSSGAGASGGGGGAGGGGGGGGGGAS